MVYAVAFILYMLRILPAFCLNKYLGPKILMIYRMLSDLIFFILIFGIFLLAYGVAVQSLLYPNSIPSWSILVNILYEPYYALFQQMSHLSYWVDACALNSTITYNSELNKPKCHWLVIVLFSIYILVTCVLLLNLLIAAFSATTTRIHEKAKQNWLYYRFEIIAEYTEKPALIPPFIIFAHVYKLFISFGIANVAIPTKCRRMNSKSNSMTSKMNG